MKKRNEFSVDFDENTVNIDIINLSFSKRIALSFAVLFKLKMSFTNCIFIKGKPGEKNELQ
jgi:hypothetical protein